MRRGIEALVDGAASAIDLLGPPPPSPPPAPERVACYWIISGGYVRTAIQAHKSVGDPQETLFDADALARGIDS